MVPCLRIQLVSSGLDLTVGPNFAIIVDLFASSDNSKNNPNYKIFAMYHIAFALDIECDKKLHFFFCILLREIFC